MSYSPPRSPPPRRTMVSGENPRDEIGAIPLHSNVTDKPPVVRRISISQLPTRLAIPLNHGRRKCVVHTVRAKTTRRAGPGSPRAHLRELPREKGVDRFQGPC